MTLDPQTLSACLDFQAFAETYWRVWPKSGGSPVPFRLTAAQVAIERAIQETTDKWGWTRLAILKYRQARCSTYCTARMQHGCMTTPGITSLSIADKMELPQQWIRRAREWLGQTPAILRPNTGATNAIELWFDRLGSRYVIGSAEGQTPGVGLTIQRFHGSEPAYWLHPSDIERQTFQAIPLERDSWSIIEGTGESAGDWWAKFWWRAKRGESDYKAIFLPWLIDEDYRLSPDGEILGLSEREKDLRKLGADDWQLAWRRWKLRNEFSGDEFSFANQYPATPDEAFLAGGRSVFTAEHVTAARKTIRKPIWQGEVSEDGLEACGAHTLYVWEQPEPNRHYAIGADVQFGSLAGEHKSGQDYHAAYIECVETGDIAARVWCHRDVYKYSKMLRYLGHRYNGAILAPERNGRGGVELIDHLIGRFGDSPYPNLYVRGKFGKFGSERYEDYGWLTDENTWPDLTGNAKADFATSFGMDWADEGAVDEMAALVYDDRNRITAPEGQHDDRVKARLITRFVAKRERQRLMVNMQIDPSYENLSDHQIRILEHIEAEEAADRERNPDGVQP